MENCYDGFLSEIRINGLRLKWRRLCISRLSRRIQYIKYCYRTLTFNSFREPTVDIILEQLLVPIGKFSERYLAKASILFIPVVHSMVLGTAYIFLIELAQLWALCIHILGHYLLIQILFNYNFACFTRPGYIEELSSRQDHNHYKKCKKCSFPKPPRAHHCSSCGKCVLLMDHHCPWINNCVGLFNHRFFFNFCLFTTMGLLFVAILTLPYYISLRQHYNTGARIWKLFPESYISKNLTSTQEKHLDMIFCFSSVVIIPLSILTAFHTKLISVGQSSIERLQARSGRSDAFRSHRNTIDNWKIFYSIQRNHQFINKVLLPSVHKTKLDGYNWKIYENTAISNV